MKAEILVPPFSLFTIPPLVRAGSFFSSGGFLSTYPISLVENEASGRINWLAFAYAFFFTDGSGEKKLRVTFLTTFDKAREENLVERLITEVEELATSLGVTTIEIENYTYLSGRLCFPTSSSSVGNFSSPDLVPFVLSRDYKLAHETSCFEIQPSKLTNVPDEPFGITYIKDVGERRRICLNLLSQSRQVNFDAIALRSLPPSLGERLFLKERYLIFATKGDSIIGLIQWTPDYHNYVRKHGTLPLFDFRCRSKYGKIFKMFAVDGIDISSLPIVRTLKLLASLRVQVCHVSAEHYSNKAMDAKLISLGAKVVQKKGLFRKLIKN